jgi:heme/copper-type cytochrome/quinol oxidase subunit 3
MALFLGSLGILFLGSVVAYVVIRVRAGEWPPPGLPPPPRGLWSSTLWILAGSGTIQAALAAARAHRLAALRVLLAATLATGLAFLASQALAWYRMAFQLAPGHSSLYVYLFYFVTGLHAAHVLAGLLPLAVVTVNAFYGRYSALRHAGVRYCAMYWHFLGGVWLTLFAMIML